MDITTATPAQIDTRLAAIYAEVGKHESARADALSLLDRIAEVQGTYEADYPWFSAEKGEAAAATVRLADAVITRLTAEAQPMEARYAAERWTRFYLVTNTGGHIHWTTGCGQCYATTQFAWLTDYSGMAYADLVEEAGSAACTVCFPDAPVETLSRATRIKYEPAEKRAAREAREAKRAAADAAKVTVQWVDGRVRAREFKSQRALTNAIAECLSSLVVYGTSHPTASEWLANIEAGRAAAGAEYDYDKALANARKRFERESAKWGNPQTAKF